MRILALTVTSSDSSRSSSIAGQLRLMRIAMWPWASWMMGSGACMSVGFGLSFGAEKFSVGNEVALLDELGLDQDALVAAHVGLPLGLLHRVRHQALAARAINVRAGQHHADHGALD